MNDIQFKVGQEHENMKGTFKVLAVKKDTISICWENGEQATTAAALQSRIIERMHRERSRIRDEKAKKAKKQTRIADSINMAKQNGIVEWISLDDSKLEAVYKNVPERADLSAEINEQLIVELYSK